MAERYTTTFQYDGNRRLFTETDPIGAAEGYLTQYTYDIAGNLDVVTDNRGNDTDFDYTPTNRLERVTDPFSQFTFYTYDPSGLLRTETNQRGYVTRYEYDQRGFTTDVYVADGHPLVQHTQTTYHPDGSVHEVTDPLGHSTTYVPNSDPALRQIQMTDTIGRMYITTYDEAGNVESAEGPLGSDSRTTKYEYDGAGRLRKTFPTGAGIYLENEYDDVGNLTGVRNEEGHWTHYTYDQLNRLETVEDAEGGVTSYEYDANGNVEYVENARGAETIYGYDERDRLDRVGLLDNGLVVSDWGAYTFQYGYDPNGNRVWEKDARGNVTDYVYNDLNQVIEVYQPATADHDRPITYHTYDPNGNVKTVTDPMGRLVTYQYDALDRLDAVTDVEGTTDYTYDVVTHSVFGAVRRQRVQDKESRITQQVFDPFGRLIELHQPDPGTDQHAAPVTYYIYDARDNLKTVTDPVGRQTWYGYNAFDRVEVVGEKMASEPLGAIEQIAAYDYYDDGTLKTSTDRGGTTTTFYYDKLNRRTKSSTPNNGQTIETEWDYDAVGNLNWIEAPNDERTVYKYDDLNRLREETVTLESGAATRFYQYDAAGNLTEKTDRNGQRIKYSYDNLNRVTKEEWQVPDGVGGFMAHGYVAEFGYYADGKLNSASDNLLGTTISTVTQTYDPLGRLDQQVQDYFALPTVTLDNDYDKVGNRTKLNVNDGTLGFTNDYVPDDLGRLVEVKQYGTGNVADKAVSFVYRADNLAEEINRFDSLNTASTSEIVARTTFGYIEKSKQLEEIEHVGHFGFVGGPSPVANYSYEYHSSGAIKTVNATEYIGPGVSTSSVTLNYDKLAQLTSAESEDSQSLNATQEFDENGNRIDLGYHIGLNNRLVSDGLYTYEYDAEGNRTKRVRRKFSRVIDNDDPGFATNSSSFFTSVFTGGTQGYGDNYDGAHSGDPGDKEATWTFTGLPDGMPPPVENVRL